MRTVTIKDVAERAGVSKSTVSQYLNGRYEYMGVDTKERIKKVIAELGYSPNKIARSLKQKNTTTIGVILANILYDFSTKILRSIEDVCNEKGYHVIICNADDNPAKEKHYIEMLLANQVDGIISIPTNGNTELYKTLKKRNFPLVFIDRILSDIDVTSVLLDNEKALRICVEDLVANKYKKIAIMTMSPTTITARRERIQGYKDAIIEHDLLYDEEYIISSPLDEMEAKLERLANTAKLPEAIIATNDLTLMQILKFVKKHEVKVPEELAIIGIDDISYADIFSPPITTVAQPAFDIGTKAAELLMEQISTGDTSGSDIHRFDPIMFRRASSIFREQNSEELPL
ncbi:LacI family DNA-binding transcriptional regulator [Oceanobacillus sp. CAU 1775]